jgi:hypothetical protein
MPHASRLARAAVALGLAVATPGAEAQTLAPTEAQATCADRTQVVSRLEERYGETLQSMGLHQNNSVLEVFASEETGTWTILVTRADGVTCLIAAGQMWDGTPWGPRGKDA